jgi:hypothetical protein
MSVCSKCCVLSGRGLCDELITRPEESYRLWCVVLCDLEKITLVNEDEGQDPLWGYCAKRQIYIYIYIYILNNNTISAHTVKFYINITLQFNHNFQHDLVLRQSARKSTDNSSHIQSTSEFIVLSYYVLVLAKIKLLLC